MSFEAVAQITEIPAKSGLRIRVGDVDLGLYRVGEIVYAMEDACPHAGFPLSEGTFEAGIITCKAHGWPFDVRTGFDPDQADGFPIPCFEVRVEEGVVLVDLDSRTNDPRRGRRGRTRTRAAAD